MATIQSWRTAAESGDAVAASACLSPDVVFVSPLTEQFRFEGRDAVHDLLAAAFTVIREIRFHTEARDGGAWALFAGARVGDQRLEEAQLLRLDDAGLIREATVFVRPLPAQTALMARLGPALARQRRRRGLAAFLAANTAPLNAMVRFGDRRVVPLARPGR